MLVSLTLKGTDLSTFLLYLLFIEEMFSNALFIQFSNDKMFNFLLKEKNCAIYLYNDKMCPHEFLNVEILVMTSLRNFCSLIQRKTNLQFL